LIGLSAVGRVTVQVLAINDPPRVVLRDALMMAGIYPRDPLERRDEGSGQS
jgi:hypothetical protein